MKTNSISTALAVQARTITTTPHLFRCCLWTGFLASAMIACGPQPAHAAVTEAWVQRYGSEAGSGDTAYKLVTDAAGNVIVVGTTAVDNQTGSGSDMLVIKYSGAGVPLWTNRHNGWGNAVATDGSGNVFVAGTSAGSGSAFDYMTIAYSGAGVPLWTNRYNGPVNSYDRATAVAVDGSGNIFVTGTSTGSRFDDDYATIAYSGAGVPLWTNRYNGPYTGPFNWGNDTARAVVVDSSGNVIVTGDSFGSGGYPDYATIAYSGAGVPLWTNRYNGTAGASDIANAVAVDTSGNVFVTGYSFSTRGTQFNEDYSKTDYATIAYSGAGVPLWTNRYNGTGNAGDQAIAVAVDAGGNVFVTGFSGGSGSGSDYATIAYSGAGMPLWTNRYNGPANSSDGANAVAVDGSGNVFVTGYSGFYDGSQSPYDYATIAYSGAGVPLWTNCYNGPGNGHDQASAVAVDVSGNVFVTGSSVGSGSGGDTDYATIAYSGAGVALWTNRFGGQGAASDIANAMAVDATGNVFVTGYSYGTQGYEDYATIAYSGAGVPLWTNRYNGSGNGSDIAIAMAVDRSGNVFVTGSSVRWGGHGEIDGDYATIAYSGAGVPLWTNRCNGSPSAIAVDGSGNVFVTGSSGRDYATIAYSGVGVPLWTNRYNDGFDKATAVAVDGSGNVFVTGGSGGDYATIAYSGAGVPLWTNRYHGTISASDQANAVAVDASGNVFVTGFSYGSVGGWDYATIAYSSAGVPLWTNRYDGPGNNDDVAKALAVDANGNVFVTGSSFGNDSGWDYATMAYSGAGVPLWTNRYNGPGNWEDQATVIAVDASGNVFVTGSSDSDSYYATIAYSGAGVPLWTNRYNGPVYIPGGAYSKSSLAIGSDGAVYVTGTSAGLFSSDFATVKYVWRTEIAIQLLSTIPPKVNLTLSGAPNSSLAVERAPEPTGPWTNLSALLIGANGSAQFQDTNPPTPAGFYRARHQ